MLKKCPVCGSELREGARRRLIRALSLLVVVVTASSLTWAAYSSLHESIWVDLSHDVLFPMPNTLVASLFGNGTGGPGATLAVWGNISNNAGWDIDPLVVIEVNDSSSLMHFYERAGMIDPGASRYFSCAYSLDNLDASSASVTVRVWGN